MRVTFAAVIFGLANIVASQQLELPECAKTCVTQATSGSNIGNCQAVDIVCICSSASFLGSIACCLSNVCNAADQTQATNFARNFCGISGVTNLPSSVVCSTSKPASTSGGSSTAAVASTTGSSQGSSTTPPAASTPVSSAPAAASTAGKSGAQKVVGVGAGILGGLAMGVALL